jgi:hypothetical protein
MLFLIGNLLAPGILIIHGDADQSVPISEGQRMYDELVEAGHKNITMVIEPGGAHTYDTSPELGRGCFDLRELFEFFQKHALPIAPRNVDFTTISPWVNDTCHWVKIAQQERQLEPSRARLQIDPGRRWIFGTLENVQHFSVDPSSLMMPGEITLQFNEEAERTVAWASGPLHLTLEEGSFQDAGPLDPSEKGPHRAGGFETIFEGNHPLLVIGTRGDAKEDRWALEKARFDSETMWYRGNASYEIVLDKEFDPDKEPDRNIILYGNANTNSAWKKLLADSPIQVDSGGVTVGEQSFMGDDLACLFVHPRRDSPTAMVAAISGTGVVGMRAGDVLPIISGGVRFPDFLVFTSSAWALADRDILATGLFANDWTLDPAASAFQ